MDTAALYTLRNVVCAYNRSTPVLRIKQLEIPEGKLIAIVGKSGSGKSTILETLGLMNNTLIEGEIVFRPEPDKEHSIGSLWNNEDKLADVRNEYLSFVFQDTNLMSNFTAIENACIPQLIQGVTFETARAHVIDTMSRVGIGNLEEGLKVYQMSGGQRQRLAFVRAITPKFKVLFGDEPTGNLDKNNSNELMRVIQQYIHEQKRSSIIVSHDINLALDFSDQIVILTKRNETGEVLPENVLHCRQTNGKRLWLNSGNGVLEDPKSYINENLL